MADTTLAAILARFREVLEGDPLYLNPTRDPFSHDRAPNTVIDTGYCLVDDGVVSQRSTSNYMAARIDRITIYVARKLKFSPGTELTTLHETLNTIERLIKADGPDHSYHADLATRRVTRPDGTDLAIASLGVNCDYDYDEQVQ